MDTGIHDLHQRLDLLEMTQRTLLNMVTDMHAELQAARPLIEKWQHSKIVQLAAGRFPWQAS